MRDPLMVTEVKAWRPIVTEDIVDLAPREWVREHCPQLLDESETNHAT